METKPYILPQYLKSKLPALQNLCKKFKIKNLWVFGSVLTDQFNDDSDVDFLYELDRPSIPDEEYLYNLDGLIAGLLEIFSGRKIDLVHYPSLRNPYFIKSVEATKKLLYAKRSQETPV